MSRREHHVEPAARPSRGPAVIFCAVAALVACAETSVQPAPEPKNSPGIGSERSAIPAPVGNWTTPSGALLLEKGTLIVHTDGTDRVIEDEVIGLPSLSADGSRAVFAHRLASSFGTAVSVIDLSEGHDATPRTIMEGGTPDRVSISPDGRTVAYVASADGLASLWTISFDGGLPTQLTNTGVVKDEPGRPAGFVAPPLTPPRFEGDALLWESLDGPGRAVLP